MHYIIDANNLAGQLKMLGEENFDKKLINKIKNFNSGKKRRITLVFDGHEQMGDKVAVSKFITAIYSPKDKYYKCADDKIIELVGTSRDLSLHNLSPEKDEVTVITDDLGIIKEVEKISEKSENKIRIIKATAFAQRLMEKQCVKEEENDDENRGLNEEEIDNINEDLLKIWQK